MTDFLDDLYQEALREVDALTPGSEPMARPVAKPAPPPPPPDPGAQFRRERQWAVEFLREELGGWCSVVSDEWCFPDGSRIAGIVLAAYPRDPWKWGIDHLLRAWAEKRRQRQLDGGGRPLAR